MEGWNTKPDGSGTSYMLASSYTANADLTLYAMWSDEIVFDISRTAGVDNVTAHLILHPEKTGKFIIRMEGTGRMKTYSNYDKVPWYEYRKNIVEATVAEGITEIAYGMLYQTSITEIIIPESVQIIGNYSFYGSTLKGSIRIPKNTTSIGSNPFMSTQVTEIIVDERNTAFKSVDGVLYSKDGKTLKVYPPLTTTEYYEVLDGVTTIASYAMQGLDAKQMKLPETLQTISAIG